MRTCLTIHMRMLLVSLTIFAGAAAQEGEKEQIRRKPTADADVNPAPTPQQNGKKKEGPNPTYSLEATAVNGKPLPGGPTARITVAQGDTITAKLFMRDWSPDHETLRAYQATLDRDCYASGDAGQIKPVAFDETTMQGNENKENCFVDRADPQYIFHGSEDFALPDTRSYGYRWLGVLIDMEASRLSAQDGKKYYGGTVHLKVSDDAQGSFEIRLLIGQAFTTLRDPMGAAILPLDVENLAVEVTHGGLRIVGSEPPSGAIDARPLSGPNRGGWDRIVFAFSSDAQGVSRDDFSAEDGTDDPPRIERVIANGNTVTVVLDRAVKPERWTTISQVGTGAGARVGWLPGDANNDGFTDSRDMFELINSSDSQTTTPDYRFDLNRDGKRGVGDALEVLDVLAEPGAHRPAHLQVAVATP